MKIWKRIGSVMLAVMAAALLTGNVMAAEAEKGLAVQLDGKELSFTDAAPEITDERTFLPFRAVLEAMGAEVGYDAETSTVSAKRGGVELAMVPGQKQLTVTESGQSRTVEMDAAPYIKESNGRTYIPVRYAAEAFGYSVGWDQDDKTVILVDVEALLGDATFELMDNFAAYCAKENQSENMAMTGKLTVELTDKTGELGSKPIQVTGSVDGIAGEKGAQMTVKLDLSNLKELTGLSGFTPMEQAMLEAMLESLSSMTAELRYDVEKETLYFLLPAELTGMENTWYSLDLGAYVAQVLEAIDLTKLDQLTEDAGVRDVLVWALGSVPLNDKDLDYEILAEAAELYTRMLSDQVFTQKGDSYTASIVLEEIVNVEIVLTKRGENIAAMDMTVTAAAEEEGMKLSMSMKEHVTPDKEDVTMDMSVEDGEIAMKLHMEMNSQPTEKVPATQPPAGAQIVPAA